jgi:hypothetical protein
MLRVRPHNYKPKTNLIGSGKYHLGIELEVEASSQDTRRAGLNSISPRQRFVYAKYDGSLDAELGWEMVTHPISVDLWLDKKPRSNGQVVKLFNFIRTLREMGYTSHENNRCGLHVHISRCAFDGATKPKLFPERPVYSRANGRPSCCYLCPAHNGLLCPHYYWFHRIVNSYTFARLSQRSNDQLAEWASQYKVSPGQIGLLLPKYRACNPTNNTVEVRIFRGNMKEERIRKAVEAVIAACEWARGIELHQWKELKDNVDAHFLQYVRDERDTFPNLHQYIQEHSKVRNTALCA